MLKRRSGRYTRRGGRAAVRYEVIFGGPLAISDLRIHVNLSREKIAKREYVIGLRGYRGLEEIGLEPGGWGFSEHLGSKYCYLPEGEFDDTIRLPPVSVRRHLTSLAIEPRGWVDAQAPVANVIKSIWAEVRDVDGNSALFQAVRQEETSG